MVRKISHHFTEMDKMDKVEEKFLTLVFFDFITFFSNKNDYNFKIPYHKKG